MDLGLSGKVALVFQAFLDRDLPHGRLGSAEEVANAVAFLLSERADWITNAHLPVVEEQG